MVFSIAYHMFQDRSRAEDLAQEVFLRLYQNLRRIRSAEHLKHWLRQVASRCAIDTLRAASPSAELALDDSPEPEVRNPERDPLLGARLRRLVASLPAESRAVVVLHYQEDLSLVEISEILDVPLNTVKSRLRRALEFLREKFEAAPEKRYDPA